MPVYSCSAAGGKPAQSPRVPGILTAAVLVAAAAVPATAVAGERRPADIVDARTVIPDLVVDMRYLTARNFIGRPIAGYRAPVCLLTKRTAVALKRVEDELKPRGLGLKVYDCYRPQRAVDDFAAWGGDLGDQKMKPEFYPGVDKRDLFRDGYIARRSGHSRGSTVDLTIVPLAAPEPEAPASAPIGACAAVWAARLPDASIDMGTGFDCFGAVSHTANAGIGAQQMANRKLLKTLMAEQGFINNRQEWWHYTLGDEPYPGTYFDFPVE
jgi:D-alanyl-D-alanine dipeptidase